MNAYTKLPGGYRKKEFARIELEADRRLSAKLKTVSALLAVVILWAGSLMLPVSALTEMDNTFVRLSVLMLGMLSVSVAHELVRGALMRSVAGVKPDFKFAGGYLHTGCRAFFHKNAEAVICLAPFVVMSAVCVILFFIVGDPSWKWIVWFVFTVAVCACAGDLFVLLRLMKMPENVLTENVGPSYLFFSCNGTES